MQHTSVKLSKAEDKLGMTDHSHSSRGHWAGSCRNGNKRRLLFIWHGQTAELLTTGCGCWEVTSANEVTGWVHGREIHQRAIKFKTTASGIGSFELHILEAWWVSWRNTTTGLPCSCTCCSAHVSGHGWEGLLSQEVSLSLLCKTKWTSILPPSVLKAKMLLVARTFSAQSWLHYSTSAMEQACWEELVEVL